MRQGLLLTVLLISVIIVNCGIYSFTSNGLPSHIKTVDIPLFENQSLKPDVADEVTRELNQQIVSRGPLKIANGRGDATYSGKVTKYENVPFTYGATAVREVDVYQYAVHITADVELIDNKKDDELFRGTVKGEGIYDFKTEEEKVGREKAIKDIVNKILENSTQGW